MEREMTADQVLAALWRRRKLVVAVSAIAFAIGVAVLLVLPSTYQSSVVVRVASPRPTEELVPRTVGESVEQRLVTVRQELMGRPVLQKVIEEFKLYPKVLARKGMEGAIEQMRSDLQVKVEGENAFELTYQYTDPKIAAAVANRLPEVFAEQTRTSRQQQAQRATQLFSGEAEALKASLGQWESKLAQFKIAHAGELPEQLEVNMRTLERIGSELHSKSDELRAAESHRSELVFARHSIDTQAGRLESAEAGLVRDLVAARSTMTEDHPDIQRMGKELSTLRQKKDEALAQLAEERVERNRAGARVSRIEGEIEDLQKRADIYQARLDRTPRWAEELSSLQRDYDITKEKYKSVVSRKVEAELAQKLELQSANGMFNVLSPAMVAIAPSHPDRLSGLILALLAALALGALAGTFVDARDESIRDVHQIKERLPLPILAVVPILNGKAEQRRLIPTSGRTPLSGEAELN